MQRSARTLILLAAFVLAVVVVAIRLSRPGPDTEVRTALSVQDALGGAADSGFARALEPRPFRFPQDHGPHPEFRTEWWYVTGNLEGPGGAPFGFQFTIFRSALEPQAPESSSAWSTNQVYMAHLALTDVESRRFVAFERFSRGALGLAGSRARPFRVWVEDWLLEGADGLFPLRLTAREEGHRIELELTPRKPLVLQGDRGLSQKGAGAGNASYYYSFTRLAARGTLNRRGEEIPVQGDAWLDREWSTSALSQRQVGWDWFALQLSDGRDLMYYQLRLEDGTPDPLSKGVLVDPDGGSSPLTSSDVELTVLDRWSSPVDGTSYPSRWRLALPDRDLVLEVLPLLPDQELKLAFRYWEGAVRVQGSVAGRPVEGRGYVELTGYAEGEG